MPRVLAWDSADEAAAYNRSRFGIGFTLRDLPLDWTGTQLLSSFDLDGDLTLSKKELDAVDWSGFTDAIRDLQTEAGFSGAALDGKLGPDTLAILKAKFADAAPRRRSCSASAIPSCRPRKNASLRPRRSCPSRARRTRWRSRSSGTVTAGRSSMHASSSQVEPAVALAIFAVESKRAYDPTTGLVIVRFEPKVFLRRSGGCDLGSTAASWPNGRLSKTHMRLTQRRRSNPPVTGFPNSWGSTSA